MCNILSTVHTGIILLCEVICDICISAESRMSREGDSRMSAYTPDQLAVHEYIARKRGTPVSHEHRYEPQEEPRHHHRKEEKKKKKVQLQEPENNGASVDDEVFSFEKVKMSFHLQINCVLDVVGSSRMRTVCCSGHILGRRGLPGGGV